MRVFLNFFRQLYQDADRKYSLVRLAPGLFFKFFMLENVGICLGLYYRKLDYAEWSHFYGDQLVALGILFSGLVGGKVGEALATRSEPKTEVYESSR